MKKITVTVIADKRGRCKLTESEVVCTAISFSTDTEPIRAMSSNKEPIGYRQYDTARTESESAVCTLCTQCSVGWPATIMFKVCK